MTRLLLIGVVAQLACAPFRFPDRPLVWRDDDEQPLAKPQSRDPPYHWMALRDAVFQPLDRQLDLDFGREAVNVNAVDETPDSTWFTNRWRGADGRPRALDATPQLPLTIIKGKDRGGNLGFIAVDARGRKFAVKLDPPGLPGMDTATEVVVSRLAWAAGWNVPEETLFSFDADDLLLAPDAKVTNVIGQKKPLDRARLNKLLAQTPHGHDGMVVALASRWIEGDIIGPFAFSGRRDDDGNDRVAHEDRRDLRGWRVFSAWVNNVDATEVNTLDSWVGARGRGHVVHWQQDVGGSFGARAALPMDYWMGYDTYLAPGHMLASLLTLGVVHPRWEGEAVRVRRAQQVAAWPELGGFDAAGFDARRWRPVFDNPAFARATRRDLYWGAKRVVELGEAQIRAAVESGHYRQKAADRLFQVLLQRRREIARAFIQDTSPLDYFRVDKNRLCWDDLWLRAGLGQLQAQIYRAGRTIVRDACVELPLPRDYLVLPVSAQRAGERHFGPTVRVHLRARDGRWQLAGLER